MPVGDRSETPDLCVMVVQPTTALARLQHDPTYAHQISI